MPVAQLDLFSMLPGAPVQGVAGVPALDRPPGRVWPAEPPPAPSVAWARLLDVAPYETILHVTWLYTGVVCESLSDPTADRMLLFSDGHIAALGRPETVRQRTLYLMPPAAQALHAERPLIRVGPFGTHSGNYRFAMTGETAPTELALPPRGQ